MSFPPHQPPNSETGLSQRLGASLVPELLPGWGGNPSAGVSDHLSTLSPSHYLFLLISLQGTWAWCMVVNQFCASSSASASYCLPGSLSLLPSLPSFIPSFSYLLAGANSKRPDWRCCGTGQQPAERARGRCPGPPPALPVRTACPLSSMGAAPSAVSRSHKSISLPCGFLFPRVLLDSCVRRPSGERAV